MPINDIIVTMTIWTPEIADRNGPRYAAIAEAIAEAIDTETLETGAKLPPQRDLAWRLGVTVGTISRAYRLAFDRGLVSGEVGRGTYVLPAARARDELVPLGDTTLIDLARNFFPNMPLHADALNRTLKDLAERPGRERLLNYMPSAGHESHRKAGADWMSKVGIKAEPEDIVLLGGVQQGISAAMASLVDAGGEALCESLTFMGFSHSAAMFNIGLTGLDLDDEGIVPEALDESCRSSRAKVLFTVPTLHNPTTATMSLERRQAIVEVARRHELTIVEDDACGYLMRDRPPPIALLAPERTVYLAGTSKSFGPGLRMAWATGPSDLIHRLGAVMFGLTVAAPALTAEIAKIWIEDGSAEKMRLWQAAEVADRVAVARDVLKGLEFRSHPAAYHLLLNLPDPWQAQDFCAAAEALGISLISAEDFAVDRRAPLHAVRLSLCGPKDRGELRGALETIRDLALTTPTPRNRVI